MKKHKGKIIKVAIKESGMPVTKIIEKIKKYYPDVRCSRTRLYYLFKQEKVDSRFIFILGNIIYHDFSKDFPELVLEEIVEPSLEENELLYFRKKKKELQAGEKELAEIRKSYIKLLKFFAKIANTNTDPIVKEKIKHFLASL